MASSIPERVSIHPSSKTLIEGPYKFDELFREWRTTTDTGMLVDDAIQAYISRRTNTIMFYYYDPGSGKEVQALMPWRLSEEVLIWLDLTASPWDNKTPTLPLKQLLKLHELLQYVSTAQTSVDFARRYPETILKPIPKRLTEGYLKSIQYYIDRTYDAGHMGRDMNVDEVEDFCSIGTLWALRMDVFRMPIKLPRPGECLISYPPKKFEEPWTRYLVATEARFMPENKSKTKVLVDWEAYDLTVLAQMSEPPRSVAELRSCLETYTKRDGLAFQAFWQCHDVGHIISRADSRSWYKNQPPELDAAQEQRNKIAWRLRQRSIRSPSTTSLAGYAATTLVQASSSSLPPQLCDSTRQKEHDDAVMDPAIKKEVGEDAFMGYIKPESSDEEESSMDHDWSQ